MLNIIESDIKGILTSSTSIAKYFSTLIKQNRIKIEPCDLTESQNVNNWCSKIFHLLKLKYKKSSDHSLLYDLSEYWSDLASSITSNSQSIQAPTAYLIENTLYNLQLQVQFNLNLLQNIFEYESLNQLAQSQDSGDSSLSVLEKLGSNSIGKKLDNNTASIFTNLVDLVQKQVKLFYDFIKCQLNQSQINHKAQLNEEELDENLKKDTNFEFSDSNKQSNSIENKQPIQIYCYLIEQMSVLFTRIKVHHILSELLINFAPTIELIAELNSLSRVCSSNAAQNSNSQTSHLNSHYRYSNQDKICVQFQGI